MSSGGRLPPRSRARTGILSSPRICSIVSWFRWPMLSREFSAPMQEPGTCWPRRRAWQSASQGILTQAPLEFGDHGGDRRVGVLAGVVDAGGAEGRTMWATPPSLRSPIDRGRRPRTSPAACGSESAPRRRPTGRSPRRRPRGLRGRPAGWGSARSALHDLVSSAADSSSAQRCRQRMRATRGSG